MNSTSVHFHALPDSIHIAMESISEAIQTEGLSKEEYVWQKQLKHEGRRYEYIAARYLVRSLGHRLGYPPSSFLIHKDTWGKPYAEAEGQQLYLSIAHTVDYVVCGMSETHDMGIDIEPAGRRVHERLGRRILHPSEKQALAHIALIRLWTMKEALVKLRGTGLRTNLNEIEINPLNETEFISRFNDDKSARICSFQHRGHWVSVAYYQ